MDGFSWKDELLANIASQIERFAWSLVYVGGDGCSVPGCPGDHESDLVPPDLPPYGYTVGLPLRFDHPELVLVGLDRASTARVLDALGSTVAKGARLAPGEVIEVDETAMKVGSCARSRVQDGLVAVSFDYHLAIGHRSLPNPLQILWSDSAGRFPGDPGLGRAERRRQPLLARRAPRDRAGRRPEPTVNGA